MEKKQKAEDMEALSDALYEFDNLKHLTEICIDAESLGEDISVSHELFLFLIKAIQGKIRYYEDKYSFKVPSSDTFFIQDYADFVRRAEGISVKSSVEKFKENIKEV